VLTNYSFHYQANCKKHLQSNQLILQVDCYYQLAHIKPHHTHLFNVAYPIFNVFKRLFVCDIIHEHDALQTQATRNLCYKHMAVTTMKKVIQSASHKNIHNVTASTDHSTSVVGSCDCSEPLLASCVPASSHKAVPTIVCIYQFNC